MSHKAAADRAKYFQDWKAGIPRTEADEKAVYIDEPVTNEVMERDRQMRQATAARMRKRWDRELQLQKRKEQLQAEIKRLSVNPFSKLVNR